MRYDPRGDYGIAVDRPASPMVHRSGPCFTTILRSDTRAGSILALTGGAGPTASAARCTTSTASSDSCVVLPAVATSSALIAFRPKMPDLDLGHAHRRLRSPSRRRCSSQESWRSQRIGVSYTSRSVPAWWWACFRERPESRTSSKPQQHGTMWLDAPGMHARLQADDARIAIIRAALTCGRQQRQRVPCHWRSFGGM